MNDGRFDATAALTFDLARGIVTTSDGAHRVLVPAEAIAALIRSAGDGGAGFGRALGEGLGKRIAARLDVSAASIELTVDHLGGELALAGLGSVVLERWGSALVLVLAGSPLAASDPVVEALLASAVGAAAGRAVRAVVLTREEGRVRVLLGGEAGTTKVRRWLGDGIGWAEALARLHAPRGDA